MDRSARYDENGERYNYTVDEETTQKLKDGSYRVSITKRPYQDAPNTQC